MWSIRGKSFGLSVERMKEPLGEEDEVEICFLSSFFFVMKEGSVNSVYVFDEDCLGWYAGRG